MEEPKILIYIKNHLQDGAFADPKNEIVPFLKSQFYYEAQRIPQHNLFRTVYQLPYFDASKMLNYWINPTGKCVFEYKIDDYSNRETIIYKRKL